MRGLSERQKWGLVAAGAGIVAGAVTMRALKRGWRVVTDDEPPMAPERAGSVWSALAWAATSAAGMAAANVLARRGAAYAWEEITGDAPPKPKATRRRRGARARLRAAIGA